jgi:predicted DNA-binding transcriptional regulator AlpA
MSEELLHLDEVLRFFGGSRPINQSTLYRGIKKGRFPRPIKPTPGMSRWLRSECKEARDRLVAQREATA